MKALLWREHNDPDSYVIGFASSGGDVTAVAIICTDLLYDFFGPDFYHWAREIGHTPMEFELWASVPLPKPGT